MYKYSHLEDYINDLYKSIGVHRPEQLDLQRVSRQLEIWVYNFAGTSEAVYSNGRQYIFLNRNLSPKQKWQEFGHELCHIKRHAGHQRKMHYLFQELQEWQADNFALHFCIPTFMLQRIRLPPDLRHAVVVIAELFQVEEDFAEERLKRYSSKLQSEGFLVAEKQLDF